MNRRLFLKSALTTSAALTAVSAGLLTPTMVFSATPQFKRASDEITKAMVGATQGAFGFKAPKIAENGAVVPLEVNASKLSNVDQIAIYAKNNATPLAASFNLAGAVGFVSTRIKMAKSSPVTAVVIANGSASKITKDVKVTVGGCGG